MKFDSQYLKLGSAFFRESDTTDFSHPRLLLWNEALADALQLPNLSNDELAQLFCGQATSTRHLHALAYAGHQFGHFNPQLGDGRAHLLGDVRDLNGDLWELQMKGSGPTPFSRGGDGFCGVGPAIREYIMSEAMASLRVPTSRTLSVITTGDNVYRQTPVPGAVVTRAAASHIRIGTFQYFAAREDKPSLKKLCDFTINRHYSELAETETDQKYVALLDAFLDRQINLVCNWLRVGFIHGVMNTDNMTLSGQTIDFGPCAMLEAYNPEGVFSSIDHHGRYAFSNQKDIVLWNTIRFAECLLQLFDDKQEHAAQRLGDVLSQFQENFDRSYQQMIHAKFGIKNISEESVLFTEKALNCMHEHELDYTSTFTKIAEFQNTGNDACLHPDLRNLLTGPYKKHKINLELMNESNPVIIPRNHLVESAIADYVNSGDITSAETLVAALKTPYARSHLNTELDQVAFDGDKSYVTFCGT